MRESSTAEKGGAVQISGAPSTGLSVMSKFGFRAPLLDCAAPFRIR